MTTPIKTFTLQSLLSLALILAMMAGMLPASAASASSERASSALAAPAETTSDQITPGLRAAIQEVLGPEAFPPANQDASDAAAYDQFGISVALRGDTALVGGRLRLLTTTFSFCHLLTFILNS